MFKNKGIQYKILFFTTILFLVSASGFGLSYWKVTSLKKNVDQLVTQDVISLVKVLEFKAYSTELRSTTYRSIMGLINDDGDELLKTREEFTAIETIFSENIAAIEKLSLSPHAQTLLKTSKKSLQLFVKSSEAIIRFAEQGQKDSILKCRPEFESQFVNLKNDLDTLSNEIQSNQKSIAVASQNDAVIVQSMVIFFLFILILCELALIRVLIKNIILPLNSCLDTIRSVSSRVSEVSDGIQTTSKKIAQGASSQAAGLEETSASMEEISSMVDANAEGAKESEAISVEARKASEQGKITIQEMAETVQGVRVSSNQLQTAVSNMQKAEQEVAKIVKGIDEIAFQTNILALNAAVEAARAGEAGSGFAVVADEVRNLARRSADAARDTSLKIESSIQISHQSVEASEQVQESLTKIDAITKKVEQNFHNIHQLNLQVNQKVSEIALASREQSTGIQQTKSALSQIDAVTQMNAGQADEASHESESLSSQIYELNHTLQALEQIVRGVSSTDSIKTMSNTTPMLHNHRR